MESKRKILFLIPSLIGGGAERTLINLLNKLDYTIFEVDLVTVLGKGVYLNEIPESVNLIILFKNEIWLKILSKLHQYVHFTIPFKYIVNKKMHKNYDVGISFLDCLYTELLHYNKNISFRFTWIHASYKSYKNFYKFYKSDSYRKRVNKYRYSKLDGLIFVSQDTLDEFKEVFGPYPNMQVIYNIINNDVIKSKAKVHLKIKKFEGCFNFISVGSLIPVKGYDLLINAANLVYQKHQNFKIHILGEGFKKDELQNLVNDLKLNEVIHFWGFQSNPYPYINAADAFVMSSVSEALPTVLCEAMILKKPTIVTNCSGCREIVNSGEFGLMAEQDDTDLAKKMILYLEDKNTLEFYTHQSKIRSQVFNDELVLKEVYSILMAK